MDIISSMDSQIQQFYKHKKVFITGGTGFMGKLLVEKLLRSTEVSTIYFLIRNKKGKSVHTRLDEYFDDIVFQKLKNQSSSIKHKIVGIPGDCSAAGLGISIDDRHLLINNVDIVFHVAATLNFDEKLKLAYSINVKGTESVLDLCRQMEKLKAYIHVSTAYSHCHLNQIDEVFYETLVNYKDLEVILEKFDEKNIDKYTPKILGKSPNTYTFTKSLAEALIKDQGSGLPIGIFRPAIVTSTYKEPLEGWIDNLNGPSGVCAGAISGLIRTLQCKSDLLANIVPADTCIAALIASAWDTANKSCERTTANIPIYNYVSTVENPITWGEYDALNKLWAETYPVSSSIWSVQYNSVESRTVNILKRIFYHMLPATFIDALSICAGKKPKVVSLYMKIHKFSDVISYFSTRHWKFSNDNVLKLWSKMNQADREQFPLSMSEVHWTLYFKKYVLGLRLYLLKDSDQTLPDAKVRNTRFKLLHKLLQFTLGFIAANFIWNCICRGFEAVITRRLPLL